MKAISEITGRRETSTIFQGVVGADGKRRFAIADIDLFCMVENCLNCRMDSEGNPNITLNIDTSGNIATKEDDFDFNDWYNRTRRVNKKNGRMAKQEKLTREQRIEEYARRYEETGTVFGDDE